VSVPDRSEQCGTLGVPRSESLGREVRNTCQAEKRYSCAALLKALALQVGQNSGPAWGWPRAADPVPDTGVSRNKLKWHSNSDRMFGDNQ
jgi:hypothetical protein